MWQPLLFENQCPCLQHPARKAGLCFRCYHRRYRSAARFGGNRENVLARDGHACRVCGSSERIVVHHRRPGRHHCRLLITLCAACHARIHRSARLRCWVPEVLAVLWQELHPAHPLQMQLPLAGSDTLLNARVAA